MTSIESNHKQVETARKGQEVCIKIEPIPGESPKMFGRHFDETDMLVSKVSHSIIIIVLLTDFGHGGQTQRRSAICAGDIIVQRVCTQAQVHSLFLYSHNPMGRQSDTIAERSG